MKMANPGSYRSLTPGYVLQYLHGTEVRSKPEVDIRRDEVGLVLKPTFEEQQRDVRAVIASKLDR